MQKQKVRKDKWYYPILLFIFFNSFRVFEWYLANIYEKVPRWGKTLRSWSIDEGSLRKGILEQLSSRHIWGWDDYTFVDPQKEVCANIWAWLLHKTAYFDYHNRTICASCGGELTFGDRVSDLGGVCYFCSK